MLVRHVACRADIEPDVAAEHRRRGAEIGERAEDFRAAVVAHEQIGAISAQFLGDDRTRPTWFEKSHQRISRQFG